MDTRRGYSENSLVEFTNSMFVMSFIICPVMQEELSPSLVAPTVVSNFFKKLSSPKPDVCQLTGEHLTSQLRVATTSDKADIDKSCKDSRFQMSH